MGTGIAAQERIVSPTPRFEGPPQPAMPSSRRLPEPRRSPRDTRLSSNQATFHRPDRPFVFNTLRIAFLATPVFSKTSALPPVFCNLLFRILSFSLRSVFSKSKARIFSQLRTLCRRSSLLSISFQELTHSFAIFKGVGGASIRPYGINDLQTLSSRYLRTSPRRRSIVWSPGGPAQTVCSPASPSPPSTFQPSTVGSLRARALLSATPLLE